MRADLTVGNPFPDIRLPETTGRDLALSEIAAPGRRATSATTSSLHSMGADA